MQDLKCPCCGTVVPQTDFEAPFSALIPEAKDRRDGKISGALAYLVSCGSCGHLMFFDKAHIDKAKSK